MEGRKEGKGQSTWDCSLHVASFNDITQAINLMRSRESGYKKQNEGKDQQSYRDAISFMSCMWACVLLFFSVIICCLCISDQKLIGKSISFSYHLRILVLVVSEWRPVNEYFIHVKARDRDKEGESFHDQNNRLHLFILFLLYEACVGACSWEKILMIMIISNIVQKTILNDSLTVVSCK